MAAASLLLPPRHPENAGDSPDSQPLSESNLKGQRACPKDVGALGSSGARPADYWLSFTLVLCGF